MPKPRQTISVVTPAHPARITSGMLERAHRSVYAQTLLPDAICIAIDIDKQGSAPTRQHALMQARTDWVAFLDSDDAFLPRHLELLLKYALDRQVDYVYSWFKVVQQLGNGTTRVLDDDPIFPMSHYLDPFDPENPIETTITTLVRTELAQQVGFVNLDRGHSENAGDDRYFTLECVKAGARVGHLVRKTWLWTHHQLPGTSKPGNTSGMPDRGDDAPDAQHLIAQAASTARATP